jgi:hypothetical protein
MTRPVAMSESAGAFIVAQQDDKNNMAEAVMA